MIEIKKRLIDKKHVHKRLKENVLIYNVRRALPAKISLLTYESTIKPCLDKSGIKLFHEYYILHNELTQETETESLPFYMMYNIPHVIDLEYLNEIINDGTLTDEDAIELIKYYHKNVEQDCYVLNSDVSEIDEKNIQRIIKKRNIQIDNYDNRHKMAGLFESCPDLQKDNIFFANMFADKEHTFFFEHSVEHVPAMMRVEASRQLLIALCHMHGNIPYKGITFILTTISVNFIKYLELNFPINMVATANKLKIRKGIWNEINITITFFQNNIEVAAVNYNGRSISEHVFEMMRRDTIQYSEQPRFHPSGMIYSNITLRDVTMQKHICKIVDISGEGFKLEFEEPLFELHVQFFEFFMFFQEIGFIHGTCELKWYEKMNQYENNLYYYGGFIINDITDADLINLKEAIKRFCYVKTERKYL